jgi:hypothetical protein
VRADLPGGRHLAHLAHRPAVQHEDRQLALGADRRDERLHQQGDLGHRVQARVGRSLGDDDPLAAGPDPGLDHRGAEPRHRLVQPVAPVERDARHRGHVAQPGQVGLVDVPREDVGAC